MSRVLVGQVTEPGPVPAGTRVLVQVFDDGEVEVAFREEWGFRWSVPVQMVEEDDGG